SEYYEKYNARTYRAHGTSHQFVPERAAATSGKPIPELKIISLDSGNGASITPVESGVSIDTSSRLISLAGGAMASRTGGIDASLISYLMEKLDLRDVQDMIDIFNHQSGLKGLSGVSSDMRDLEAAEAEGNERAELALRIFEDRVRNYVGQYIVKMEGVDALVFTAGIGENAPETQENIIKNLELNDIKLDEEKNNVRGEERVLSTDDSTAKILLMPTHEEVMIARDVERLKK